MYIFQTVDEVDDGEGNNGEGKVDESVDACWLGIVAESETSAVEQVWSKLAAAPCPTNVPYSLVFWMHTLCVHCNLLARLTRQPVADDGSRTRNHRSCERAHGSR